MITNYNKRNLIQLQLHLKELNMTSLQSFSDLTTLLQTLRRHYTTLSQVLSGTDWCPFACLLVCVSNLTFHLFFSLELSFSVYLTNKEQMPQYFKSLPLEHKGQAQKPKRQHKTKT